jgi:hypothetical protein
MGNLQNDLKQLKKYTLDLIDQVKHRNTPDDVKSQYSDTLNVNKIMI